MERLTRRNDDGSIELISSDSVSDLMKEMAEKLCEVEEFMESNDLDTLADLERILDNYGRGFTVKTAFFQELMEFRKAQNEGRIVVLPFSDRIEELYLSTRAYNALYYAGYRKISQLMLATSEELLAIKNLGRLSLGEIKEKIKYLRGEKL